MSGTVTPSADLRLVPAAVAAWTAGWCATGSTAPAVWASAGAALALALGASGIAVRHARLRRRAAATALTLAVAAAVLAGAAGALTARRVGEWPRWVADRAVARLEGVLASDPQRLPSAYAGAAERYIVMVDARSALTRGHVQRLSVPVLVVAPSSWRELSAGQRVTLSGRLAPAESGDEAAAVVTALGAPSQVLPGTWPWRLADHVREALRAACRGLPPDAGGLLPSLVDGDGSGLSDQLRVDLRTSGLSHLTAVSGANLTIIAESVLWVAGAVRAPRAVRLPLMIVTLAGFVVLARPSPSVLRAAGMGGVGIIAAALSRRPRGLPALAAAAVVLLIVDPWLARSAGFALSAAATAGLLLLAPRWVAALTRALPRPAAVALAVPAAAQVACAPLLILLQPSLSLVAVPANLLAEPVVAPTTVLGVITAGIGTVAPPAAHLGALAGGLGTGWIALVAHRGAALPLATVPWPSGAPGVLLLALLSAVGIVISLPELRRAVFRLIEDAAERTRPGGRRRRAGDQVADRGRAGPRGVPVSRRRALLGLTAAVTGGVAVWAAGLRPRPSSAAGLDDWSVVMCDVGQGDATVLRCGHDRAVLVDTGPDPTLVDECLRRLGVRHLDLVLLTHFHADHVGGLAGALAGRVARTILVSPLAEPAENAADVLRLAGVAHVPVETARPRQQGICAADGWSVAWRVLTPFGPLLPPGPPETDESDVVNESSVAVTADVRGPSGWVKAVLLGDLETEGQRALAERLGSGADVLDGPVDVVKVAHHGSAKQHEALYRRIDARVGLIGVGAGNDYGHPAPSALALLRRAGAAVLRTDTSGDLAIAGTSSGGLRIATSR
jgi:competence protein ComEC